VSGVTKVQQSNGAALDLTVLPDPRPVVEQTVVVTRRLMDVTETASRRFQAAPATVTTERRPCFSRASTRWHLAHRAAVRCVHEVSHGAQD
jgi:hypothetical protein